MIKEVYVEGDRVVLIDSSRSAGMYLEGSQGTVFKHEEGRVWVLFDGTRNVVSGNELRFRRATKLEKVLI